MRTSKISERNFPIFLYLGLRVASSTVLFPSGLILQFFFRYSLKLVPSLSEKSSACSVTQHIAERVTPFVVNRRLLFQSITLGARPSPAQLNKFAVFKVLLGRLIDGGINTARPFTSPKSARKNQIEVVQVFLLLL